jgi:preprotein translocase subunit SecE
MNWWQRLKTFLSEVVVETRKVSWPSRDEVVATTVVVIVTVFVCAVYLFAVDKVLETGMTRLFQAFGR